MRLKNSSKRHEGMSIPCTSFSSLCFLNVTRGRSVTPRERVSSVNLRPGLPFDAVADICEVFSLRPFDAARPHQRIRLIAADLSRMRASLAPGPVALDPGLVQRAMSGFSPWSSIQPLGFSPESRCGRTSGRPQPVDNLLPGRSASNPTV